ncbi:hypothetical protein, partial [Escherichia coli]|uniref:hypothetical protein n=2 Tax=Escherichia coli TaxID=562 RepID=UPI00390AC144
YVIFLINNPATVPGFLLPPLITHTVQKTTTTSLQLSLCNSSHKINPSQIQPVISKTTNKTTYVVDDNTTIVLNKFIATTQSYGNHLIHRCDDRLDPQLEFQQASGSARGETDA